MAEGCISLAPRKGAEIGFRVAEDPTPYAFQGVPPNSTILGFYAPAEASDLETHGHAQNNDSCRNATSCLLGWQCTTESPTHSTHSVEADRNKGMLEQQNLQRCKGPALLQVGT